MVVGDPLQGAVVATEANPSTEGNAIAEEPRRERIVILGGGVSAISAAYELTNYPDWEKRYDITVYQLGWRLGGKCASGRNLEHNDRIEEHGLHILCGFYENAFRMIRQCYGDLVDMGLRHPDDPNGTWDQAFHPCTNVDLCEYVPENRGQDNWLPWELICNPHDGPPGDADNPPPLHSPWDFVCRAINKMLEKYTDSPHAQPAANSPGNRLADLHPTLFSRLEDKLKARVEAWESGLKNDLALAAEKDLLFIAARLAEHMPLDSNEHLAHQHHDLLWLLDRFMAWLWGQVQHEIETNTETRRLIIVVGLMYAYARGMIADGVLTHGFSILNDRDYKQWIAASLEGWPGDKDLIIYSAPVRGTYDLVFAFKHGDTWTPTHEGSFALEAGTGLYFMMRLLFTYRGAVYYRMMGGTADVIFGPLYQVLKARGVKYKFFHRVQNLGISQSEPNTIGSITLGRQVTLRDESKEYEPLYPVKGLPCWPDRPLYDQINEEEARELQARNINLESSWTPWPPREEITLVHGHDFDRIVLGIPVSELRFICAELIAARPEWDNMINNVLSVKTLATQYWLNRTTAELGYQSPHDLPAMLDGFIEPLNSWADHTDLLPLENWPAEGGPDVTPQSLAHLCGPLLDDPLDDPPFSDHEFPAQQDARAEAEALAWLEQHSHYLWPDGSPGGVFDWNNVFDPRKRQGRERLQAQFWRANIDPFERYTLSVPNSTIYRMAPDASGFGNLYLCGDWTLNSINAGCVEATVISGMLASRAICGHPQNIYGED